MDRRRAGGGSPIDFTSVTGYVGWDFAANTNLTLTGLGFCDAGGNGVAESHQLDFIVQQAHCSYQASSPVVPRKIGWIISVYQRHSDAVGCRDQLCT
jgi:hypothetical protein